MKPISLIAASFAASMALASCAGTVPNSGAIVTDITTFEQDVVAGAQAACGVSPLFATVGALFGIAPVAAIVSQICSAVAAQPRAMHRRLGGRVVPAPVVVYGKRVAFR